MNNKLPPRWLVVGLMMFPQIVETIYSPALTQIATSFQGDEGQASQTLSVYFLAFAAGVVCWGRLCDLVGGARHAGGLLTYMAPAPCRRCWTSLKPRCWPDHLGLGRRRGIRGDPDHAARQLSGQRFWRGSSVMGA